MIDLHKIGTTDPIGKILQACLGGIDHIPSKCLDEAFHSYDLSLNEIYAKALSQNDPATQKTLRNSQRKWISFRQAERVAQLTYFKTHTGSAMGIVIGWQNVTAIRERIAELMYYLGADQG